MTTQPLPDNTEVSGSGNVAEADSKPHHGDRMLGLLCLAIAIWYVFETRNFAVTSFGSGPVGPKTLPTLVGIMFGVFALVLIIKPDESPTWASFNVWWRLAVVTGVSFLFGQLLLWLGFIVASSLMAVIVGAFFKGPLVKLIPMSIAFSVVLAFIFNNWLELQLPAGLWGGF